MSEEKETPVATTAIPVAAPAEIAMREQEKQGAKCCGCCCDYRRAVVVISILYIIYNIVMIILWSTGGGAALASRAYIGDLTEEAKDDLSVAGAGAIVIAVVNAIFLVCNIFALCAALRYSMCMLSTMVVVILIQFGFDIYSTIEAYNTSYEENGSADGTYPTGTVAGAIVVSVIVYVLYLYPVVGLLLEIKNGSMSQETYPREAYSCCCKPTF